MMLIHGIDACETAIGRGQEDLDKIKFHKLMDNELAESEFGPGTNLRREIEEWCPYREPYGYYIGWKILCTWMHLSSNRHKGEDIEKRFPDYIEMTYQLIANLLDRYEQRFDDALFTFWQMAEQTIAFAIGDEVRALRWQA